MTEKPFYPYGRQSLDSEDIAAVVAALKSDFLTTGPRVNEFERNLAEIAGCRHAVAVNSGTSALHALYYGAGIGPDDEIIVPPLTFAATASAALHLGAKVVFADVEPGTGNIDPKGVASLITDKTRAVVAVDYAGHPADYDALRKVTEGAGIRLLSDSAHALGATYRGRPVGAFSDGGIVSLHPVKPVTTAEGGAVLTGDADMAKRAARFRNHGMVREPEETEREPAGPWYYEIQALGLNYRLSDIQCALGTSQLRKLEAFVRRRQAVADRYFQGLAAVDGLRLPTVRDDVASGWHLFVVRTEDPGRRSAFFRGLREAGLGVQVHYIPVYWHPYYQSLGYAQGLCPEAEAYYSACVSLPMYPQLTDSDVEVIVDRVRGVAEAVL